MTISIDPASYTPPFEQIRLQILERIRSGAIEHGSRLPTVRRLAGDLGLAPNTVARAYRELEQVGAVETRGRHGTFVALSEEPGRRAAEEAASSYAALMRRLGIAADDAVALVRVALDR